MTLVEITEAMWKAMDFYKSAPVGKVMSEGVPVAISAHISVGNIEVR